MVMNIYYLKPNVDYLEAADPGRNQRQAAAGATLAHEQFKRPRKVAFVISLVRDISIRVLY